MYILGVAYKQDIDDCRESPALKVMENFKKEGSIVVYNDPYIPTCKYKACEYCSVELTAENLQSADLVVITTMHSCYDYEFIQKNSKFIFDTKNAMKNVEERENIELL
ncbi:UDP-N-acetyl-D-glucosamine 6-dehydrogenase [bioreactor metagenome]|uniref:UDP-N-acetyl-D-glucosamine 6-dehydrogenase n=1 Tax=bioreactor metagenome TaxID=1076179 RepID=A0A645E3Z5_9ZZZZ